MARRVRYSWRGIEIAMPWTYPFRLCNLDCWNNGIDWLDKDRKEKCLQAHEQACEISHNRFLRREARKWRKAHPGKKPPPTQHMPGSWVD